MTIKVPYRGILEIVGDHDVGKTIAALQTTNRTKDLVFIDDDVKGEGTVKQMKEAGMEFDLYVDLAQERAKLKSTPTADELLEHVVLPTVQKIIAEKRKIIIWDTWRIVYQAARGHVERNTSRYSHVVTFRGSSDIIQGLISKVARMIERDILNDLKSACELLIVTHHIKDRYVKNEQIGKIPESSSTFSEVCNMRVWLRRNEQSKVPIILFLKRPSLPVQGKSGLRFVNVVPLKITPTDKHESIWDAIAEYERNPIESRAPRPDETPTSEELAAISGTLSPEQELFLQRLIAYQIALEKDLSSSTEEHGTPQEALGQTQTEASDSYPANGLAAFSKAKAELSVSLADLSSALGMSFNEFNDSYEAERFPEYWEKLKEYSLGKAAQNKSSKASSKTKK